MADDAQILDILAKMLAASRQMLALAQAGNWDDLADQDQARRDLIGMLKARSPAATPLSPAGQSRVDALLGEILKLDRETETLVQNRMADMEGSFQSIGVSRRLNSVYGNP